MKFCPNCGAELKPEAKFCAACGTPIVAATAPPVEPEPKAEPAYQQQEPVYEQAKEATHAFTDAITGKTNLVQRVINLLTKPKEEWTVIATEKPDAIQLIGGYALILALIPAIASLIGYGLIGISPFHSITLGIKQGLMQLFSAVISVYVLSFVIDGLAPSFDSEKNIGKSMQLAVYSFTALWIAEILLILPAIGWLGILAGGIFSIYLLAIGLPALKGTPKDKVVGYVALIIIASMVILAILQLILLAILGLIFVGSLAGFGF